jgi:hypothetical protein
MLWGSGLMSQIGAVAASAQESLSWESFQNRRVSKPNSVDRVIPNLSGVLRSESWATKGEAIPLIRPRAGPSCFLWSYRLDAGGFCRATPLLFDSLDTTGVSVYTWWRINAE